MHKALALSTVQKTALNPDATPKLFFFPITFLIWFFQNNLSCIYSLIVCTLCTYPCTLDWPLYIILMVACFIIFALPSRGPEKNPDEVENICTSLQNIFLHLPLLSLCTSCFLTWNQLAPYLLHPKPCVFADSGKTGTYLCGPASAPCRETSGLSFYSFASLLPSCPIPVCLSAWDCTTILISLGQGRGQGRGATVKAEALPASG